MKVSKPLTELSITILLKNISKIITPDGSEIYRPGTNKSSL